MWWDTKETKETKEVSEMDSVKREINRVQASRNDEIYRLNKRLEELEEEERRANQPKGKRMIEMYLHGSSEDAYDQGENLGLSDTALQNFSYALYEVKFDIELDCETGDTVIMAVDGIPLNRG